MRHRMSGKRLGRTTSHRVAMRRNMAASLFEHGAIRTTEQKAKELRRFVERLITYARRGTLHARRLVLAQLGADRGTFSSEGEPQETTVVQKLFDEIAPRYADRPGGYTRIVRLAERRIGDAGRQVVLQLVEEALPDRDASTGASRRRRRAAKRHEAVAGAVPAEGAPETGQAFDEAPAEETEAVGEGTGADEAEDTQADEAGEAGTEDEPKKQ